VEEGALRWRLQARLQPAQATHLQRGIDLQPLKQIGQLFGFAPAANSSCQRFDNAGGLPQLRRIAQQLGKQEPALLFEELTRAAGIQRI
jgi:hypothetical protein